MASSSLDPIRRWSTSVSPRLVAKLHFPPFSTSGTGNGQASLPTPTVASCRFLGSITTSSFSCASSANLARSLLSWISSPELTSAEPSAPKIAISAGTSWLPAAATSASAAWRGEENDLGVAGEAARELVAIPKTADASKILSFVIDVSLSSPAPTATSTTSASPAHTRCSARTAGLSTVGSTARASKGASTLRGRGRPVTDGRSASSASLRTCVRNRWPRASAPRATAPRIAAVCGGCSSSSAVRRRGTGPTAVRRRGTGPTAVRRRGTGPAALLCSPTGATPVLRGRCSIAVRRATAVLAVVLPVRLPAARSDVVHPVGVIHEGVVVVDYHRTAVAPAAAAAGAAGHRGTPHHAHTEREEHRAWRRWWWVVDGGIGIDGGRPPDNGWIVGRNVNDLWIRGLNDDDRFLLHNLRLDLHLVV